MQEILERVSRLLAEKLLGWFDNFVALLPNMVLAIAILVLARFLAKGVSNVAFQVFRRFFDNVAIVNLFVGFTYYMVITAGLFISLHILYLETTVTSLLAGAGVIGLALSFAFQDLATNLISGLFIIIQKPFRIGDFIETNGFEGYVERINIRSVTVRTIYGQFVILPSKDVFQSPLKNYNAMPERLLILPIGVSYQDDLEKVKQVTIQAATHLGCAHRQKPPQVFFTSFNQSSIDLELQVWLKDNTIETYLDARSSVIQAVKRAYDFHEITIPYPIRTLDFGKQRGLSLNPIPNLPENQLHQ